MKIDLRINRLAQGLDPLADGEAWFASLDEESRRRVVRALVEWSLQAGMTPEDGADSISASRVKPTSNAARLIVAAGSQKVSLAKLSGLRDGELEGVFRLLLLAFSKADARRRARECADGCSHWWHQLS